MIHGFYNVKIHQKLDWKPETEESDEFLSV